MAPDLGHTGCGSSGHTCGAGCPTNASAAEHVPAQGSSLENAPAAPRAPTPGEKIAVSPAIAAQLRTLLLGGVQGTNRAARRARTSIARRAARQIPH